MIHEKNATFSAYKNYGIVNKNLIMSSIEYTQALLDKHINKQY